MCLFPKPESALTVPSPGSRLRLPPLSCTLQPSLSSPGQFISSCEGGAMLHVSQGQAANQNCSGAFQGRKLITRLGQEFSKRSLWSQCGDCTFPGSCPGSLAEALFAGALFYLPLLHLPARVGRETSRKSRVCWRLLCPERGFVLSCVNRGNINM